MKIKLSFIIFISLIGFLSELPKKIQKKVNKEINSVFSSETYELQSIGFNNDILAQLPADFSDNHLFKIEQNDELLGYAYVSKAPSKTDEFDYLILFDTNFIILKSKVLIYREDYGNEIGSKRWLKQFIGKTQNDELKYGDNIAAISGATISVRSMTKAVNDVLASIKILHKNQIF